MTQPAAPTVRAVTVSGRNFESVREWLGVFSDAGVGVPRGSTRAVMLQLPAGPPDRRRCAGASSRRSDNLDR